jgi:hypothetical protein
MFLANVYRSLDRQFSMETEVPRSLYLKNQALQLPWLFPQYPKVRVLSFLFLFFYTTPVLSPKFLSYVSSFDFNHFTQLIEGILCLLKPLS